MFKYIYNMIYYDIIWLNVIVSIANNKEPRLNVIINVKNCYTSDNTSRLLFTNSPTPNFPFKKY